jgi:hypothetical protein
MGTTKFDETWWMRGHGTFGAHEEGCILRTWASLFKGWILPYGNPNLQNKPHKTKRNKKKKDQKLPRGPFLVSKTWEHKNKG